MAHDLFISHSTKDKTISDAICAALEGAGIRCWIAPRDVQPGRSFAGEINRAIQHSKVMVLVFSASSNNSEQVLREVQLAVNSHLHILQFRIEDVRLNDDLEYFLSTPHWLDAMEPPLENHIGRLTTSVKALLHAPAEQSVAAAASTETQTPATVAPRFESASSSQMRDAPAAVPQKREVSTARKAPSPPVSRRRKFLFAGAIVALLAAGALGGWWFGIQQPRKEAEQQRQLTEQKEKDQRDNAAKLAEQERPSGEGKAKVDADVEKERLASQQRAKEEAKKKEDSLESIAAATKAKPYKNSLGMKFVPVAGTDVLFSIWETRVSDFEAFVKATGHNAEGGMYSLEKGGWKEGGRTWKDPGFPQTGEHAVCGVSWEDATAFCEWLTNTERKAGRLSVSQSYRLPTDPEWSVAVGLKEESGSTPEKRSGTVKGVYPWGTKFPPPAGAGNYAGSEARTDGWQSDWDTIEGYRDEYPRTSPVGSFEANEKGIYDLGGNVWEWCQDWWNAEHKFHVLRGASWNVNYPDRLLSSYRYDITPEPRSDHYGFRCVLALESSGSEEEAKKKEDSLKSIAAATQTTPYENSLGMKFVPVPITGGPTSGKPVLFSVWETRVRDFAQFIEESGYDMKKGDAPYTFERDGKGRYTWKQAGGDWRDPHFPTEAKQTKDHPVVCVSWEDAVAFSGWLTEREHKAGRLPTEWAYRLPSDHEWSCAVGIGEQENANQTPEAKDCKIQGVYPWGKAWPPPRGAGNYGGEESRIGVIMLEGYRDGAPRTSEAGQYEANQYRIHDLGGNVWEWCGDWYNAEKKHRAMRGASWLQASPNWLLSSFRSGGTPESRNASSGFRCMLVVESSR
jgi:formylglycine-generating enzyme required for sulfatase activity